jgi:hypothetical protein
MNAEMKAYIDSRPLRLNKLQRLKYAVQIAAGAIASPNCPNQVSNAELSRQVFELVDALLAEVNK